MSTQRPIPPRAVRVTEARAPGSLWLCIKMQGGKTASFDHPGCTKIWFTDNHERPLGEIYYYDKKRDVVLTLDKVDGVYICPLPPVIENVRPSIHSHMADYHNAASDWALSTIMRAGLTAIDKQSSVMRALYYDAMPAGELPALRAAQKSDWVCNVVYDGRHIYSKEEKTVVMFHSLYRCHYDAIFPPGRPARPYDDSSEHCAEYVVLQHVKAKQRYSILAGRLGLWQGCSLRGGQSRKNRVVDDVDEMYSEETELDSSDL